MTSTPYKDQYGTIEWRNEQGKLHRENGPAREYANGDKEWFMNGLPHRENGPAIEFIGYKKIWCRNGQIHRENGPAIVHEGGLKEWYVSDQRHRENGPAVEWANGRVEYYLKNKGGPDIEQKVKENVARLQAQKEQQELISELSQDQDISTKINISSPQTPKKL